MPQSPTARECHARANPTPRSEHPVDNISGHRQRPGSSTHQLDLDGGGGPRVEQLQLLRLGQLELGQRQHKLPDTPLRLVLTRRVLQELQRLEWDEW